MKRTGPMNYQVQQLLTQLDKARESKFWKRVASEVRKPTRQRRVVNLYKIAQYAREGETVLVPGKVLSVGELTKKVDVAAMTFSSDAKRKIEGAQGKALSITELFAKNPEGKNIRILA